MRELISRMAVSAATVCLAATVSGTITNSIGMRLVRIEAGRFLMGQDGPAADYALSKHPEKFDDADWDEKPAHDVAITQGYYLGATEVTLGQYRSGMKTTLRVAQSEPNPWGLYDMHSNLAEWCNDWYGPYESGLQTDPLGRSAGDFRVIRGGSHSSFARLLRSANRAAWLPQTKSNKVGFRVVLGALPKGTALPLAALPLNARNVKQGVAKIEALPQDVPVFSGPKPFVKIAAGSFGPLFSAHNHSPSLTECPNGDLLAVWYSCVDEGGSEVCNLASRLRMGSDGWEPASPFWDGADVNDHAPKVWWDGDKTLYHFARGLNENVMRTSTDNGATWSPASVIQPVGEFGNRVLRLSDGTLVLGNDARQVSLVYSKDGGRTWAYNEVDKRASDFKSGGKGVRYPGIHAPMVQLGDGRIMLVSRNDKPEEQEKFGFKTPMSFSADLGKTWTYKATEFPALSSVQRAAMIRLREGPILLCSFTDQWRDWKNRKGMAFKKADGSEFTGYGLFAALSYDDGKTWAVRRLVTPGGAERQVNGIDRVQFALGDTLAEPCGYLDVTQTRDGNVQLITSKNHYAFNLAWLKTLPQGREVLAQPVGPLQRFYGRALQPFPRGGAVHHPQPPGLPGRGGGERVSLKLSLDAEP